MKQFDIIRPSSREAWLEERKKGVGASEAGILMGVDGYRTRMELWNLKTGRAKSEPESEQAALGHYLEPVVARRFADVTGSVLVPGCEGDWLARNKEKPFLQVSPDYLFWPAGAEQTDDNLVLLEIKSRGSYVDSDSYPDKWFTQVQYQMGVTGIPRAVIAWICPEQKHLHVGWTEVGFNAGYWNYLEKTITEFWTRNILGDTPPEASPAEAPFRFPREIPGSSIAADAATLDLLHRLADVKASGSSTQAERKELENRIKLYMGDNEVLTDPDSGRTLVSWRLPQAKTELDAKGFFEEQAVRDFLDANPGLYDKWLVSKQGERRFLAK